MSDLRELNISCNYQCVNSDEVDSVTPRPLVVARGLKQNRGGLALSIKCNARLIGCKASAHNQKLLSLMKGIIRSRYFFMRLEICPKYVRTAANSFFLFPSPPTGLNFFTLSSSLLKVHQSSSTTPNFH